MTTHDLMDEPESTVGSRPIHEKEHRREAPAEEHEAPPSPTGARHFREEGDETGLGEAVADLGGDHEERPDRWPPIEPGE